MWLQYVDSHRKTFKISYKFCLHFDVFFAGSFKLHSPFHFLPFLQLMTSRLFIQSGRDLDFLNKQNKFLTKKKKITLASRVILCFYENKRYLPVITSKSTTVKWFFLNRFPTSMKVKILMLFTNGWNAFLHLTLFLYKYCEAKYWVTPKINLQTSVLIIFEFDLTLTTIYRLPISWRGGRVVMALYFCIAILLSSYTWVQISLSLKNFFFNVSVDINFFLNIALSGVFI